MVVEEFTERASTAAGFHVPKKANYTVHPSVDAQDFPGFHQFKRNALFASFLLVPLAMAALTTGLSALSFTFWFALLLIPTFAVFMFTDSAIKDWALAMAGKQATASKLTDFMTFRDPALAAKYGNASHIPMETFYEAYFDQKIDIKGDMLDMLEHRGKWAGFRLTGGHLKFFMQQFVSEVAMHTREQDETQVRDHYDRGNDFYSAFLGPMMVYTSGIINDRTQRESLEQMQLNKLNLVCEKIQLKPNEKLLDIGCGWGTLLIHAAKKFGATATGVTLAKEQTQFAMGRAQEEGVLDNISIMNHDYRDIPKASSPNGTKYNKITCLEMAEHVGIFKFNAFLNQVSELLEDDGVFYLQIAGLRRPWQYEDLTWGLFMNKYIFPGADASCPLAWVIQKLEYAGFEVQSVDTIGVHYSATIERWYQNWMKPEHKERIVPKYTERWWRIWELFLAWSTVISRQGSATCYQIVCHKNKNTFDRTKFLTGYGQKRLVAE